MSKFIVFDLDGTLSNIEHRLPYIEGEKKDWDSFFEACDKDDPIKQSLLLFKALITFREVSQEYYKIVILTGRSFKTIEKTIEWLNYFLGKLSFDELLIMRSEGDYRPDHIIKYEWGKEVGFENIFCVFEDRQSVVDMWKDNGVTVYQVWNKK